MFIITLGDPLSINIELVASFLQELESLRFDWQQGVSGRGDAVLAHEEPNKAMTISQEPLLLIGSYSQWLDQCQRLKLDPKTWVVFSAFTEVLEFLPGKSYFLDVDQQLALPFVPAENMSGYHRGLIASSSLHLLKEYKHSASDHLAVLTCPISKQYCAQAGFSFSGQTEFFESLWKSEALMLLSGPKLRVGLVTNHLALNDVTSHIHGDLIIRKLSLLKTALQDLFHIPHPRLAVCGLNPHCGDGGLFGREDGDIIAKAVQSFNLTESVRVVGPVSADTVFYRAHSLNEFDAVLAMYHDQGLGPLKTVHFDEAVNISAGLKHLRVSCDHGPAESLFLKKTASHRSFQEALAVVESYFLAKKGKSKRG